MTTPKTEPVLRAAICGSGMRSRSVWQRHISLSPNYELVGVADPSKEALASAVAEGYISFEQSFSNLDEMLHKTKPDVLIVCPIHSFHAAAARAGLENNCHVLVEKPLTTDIVDAREIVQLASVLGLKLGVVQNWRSKSVGRELKLALEKGLIGEVSHIVFRYLRDREHPHLPEYLFDEEDPILYAMAIHHFDLFRYILNQEITYVAGHAMRPKWSRYRTDSINDLWMQTDGGVAISYVASFSSRNAHIPQESLQVEGELGTIFNDSDYFEPPLMLSLRGSEEPIDLTASVKARDQKSQYDLADKEILRNFHAAVTTNEPLIAPAQDNLGTLAVIEKARIAFESSRNA